MTIARLTGAKSLFSRKSVLRNIICLTGVVAGTFLTGLGVKTQPWRPTNVQPTETQMSYRTSAASRVDSLTDGVTLEQESPGQVNHPSLTAGSRQTASTSLVPNGNSDITVVPKIDVVVEAPHLWADGQTPAIVFISLKAFKGNETWNYSAREEMLFQLEPRNAMFAPSQVKIPVGKSTSEPAILRSKQPIKLQLRCSPERKYAGVAVTDPQPENVEFITPIDAIGIEPASDTCPVNVAIPFEVFLYNKKDPNKTRLSPRSSLLVHVVSESGNGKIVKQPVELTQTDFSKFFDYVGTKPGKDTIKATASYEGSHISVLIDRKIVFPLWIFLSGFFGSVLGSGVRYLKAIPSERTKTFLESLFYGVVVCLILIIYPPGTKLPELHNYLQPLLIFVLGALVSAGGPPSLHWALSFIPKVSGQESG